MHKYILIPDSFKGTLSARDFCAVAREAIGRADPGAQVLSIPLADGGEGTVEAFLAACGGRRIECPCAGPYGGTAPGFYPGSCPPPPGPPAGTPPAPGR